MTENLRKAETTYEKREHRIHKKRKPLDYDSPNTETVRKLIYNQNCLYKWQNIFEEVLMYVRSYLIH